MGCAASVPQLQPTLLGVQQRPSQPQRPSLPATAPSSAGALRRWMGDTPALGRRTLRELTLPGTHDSDSYCVTSELAGVPRLAVELEGVAKALGLPQPVVDWSRAQALPLYEQFSRGIRYADLRACLDRHTGSWRGCHGAALAGPFQAELDAARRFLDDNPSEVLVLEITNLGGGPSAAEQDGLATALEGTFGTLLYPPADNFTSTVDALRARGWRCMVVLESDVVGNGRHPLLWPRTAIRNSYANTPDLAAMERYNAERVQEFARRGASTAGCLFKISWTLTPNAATVIASVDPSRPCSLFELAAPANQRLAAWFAEVRGAYQYPVLGNIIIIDHFDTSPVVEVARWGLEPPQPAAP